MARIEEHREIPIAFYKLSQIIIRMNRYFNLVVYSLASFTCLSSQGQAIDPNLIFRNFQWADGQDDPNIIVYPDSRYALFAGLYPGSSGNLKSQIEDFFGLDILEQEKLSSLTGKMGVMHELYDGINLSVNYSLGLPFRTDYLNELHQLGFRTNDDKSSEGILSMHTYLHKDYLFQFDGLPLTVAEEIFIGSRWPGKINFLHTFGHFRYFKNDNLTYLEIPTNDSATTLFMVYANNYHLTESKMPHAWGFEQLRAAFNADLLQLLRSSASDKLVEVKFPISNFFSDSESLELDRNLDLFWSENHQNIFAEGSLILNTLNEQHSGALDWDRIVLRSSTLLTGRYYNSNSNGVINTSVGGGPLPPPPSHRLIAEFTADHSFILGIWNESEQRVLALGQYVEAPYESIEKVNLGGSIMPTIGEDFLSTSWQFSAWMGWIYPVDSHWVFSQDYGWLWVYEYSATGTFLWHLENGWGWTRAENYPYVYFFDHGWWLPSGSVVSGS